MRSEQQVYNTILTFAKADERIRMVTLEGSWTNINIPADDFQDYDITFFVTDMQSFIADDEWLDVFGERLIMQQPFFRPLILLFSFPCSLRVGFIHHIADTCQQHNYTLYFVRLDNVNTFLVLIFHNYIGCE